MAGAINPQSFSDSLVILGAAGLVIPGFARFRISPVIGFILVGLAVGPSGLGALVGQYPWLYHVTISNREAIEPFAELGVILLLFSIGLELSFRRLWVMRTQVFGVGATELVGSAALIALGLYWLGQPLAGAIGLGLALALSSTAVVLPMVGTQSAVGRAAFAMLLFEDLALVPIIFMLGALAPSVASSPDGAWGALADTLLKGGITIAVMLVLGRIVLPRIFSQAARTKSPEVFLAASLLVVIISSIATSVAGLSPIVGALLAGLLIAETEYHGEVEVMTAPFKGLALGVFLITVGMSLDVRVILANWPSLVLAVFGVVLAKTVVTAALLYISGARKGVALEVGVLMASPSETTLIVLSTAAAANLILPSTAAFWQIVTAIGLTITPLLARIGHDIARRLEMALGEDTPDLHQESTEAAAVVIGFGRVGRMVCDLLRVHNQRFTVVESDPDVVAQGRRDGYPILFGDVSRVEMLDKLRLGHARALILTMDDPVLSIRVTKRVRGWVPDLPIIARARDTDHAAQLYRAGASDAVPETLESSLQLAETALIDLGIAMGPVIASIHQTREDLRMGIKDAAQMDTAPKLRRLRPDEVP
ncbi:putative Glutathione-regulated potassium-efflux system protein KefB [Sphingobium herbicidovorans NBRC 16415]|jgi:monovalent cation:H+ antiporter-2, CPA2 family|uniref:Glutathione-regulated potassium-efflux system protein KefB n=1 Tax=Sphingobium herbicidovorans (strain ATCC 700291 / DSM 11019 / CCUG 56400 / KCTC 2939 / LMG 18315 / NBRC 16415 / MH) TaxID=1219045 RepID=A0A086P9N6_SPHHM|nr:cation:proton antiporter [Sphingobium herbicidovorans]KFG90104.1 putative Glutathione-regulated potassium-efflux system protein KefB [Sphingobium herbicidovorans NBRC 16415]